ncbi:MAG: 50S ribosomal protein L1 [Planctomycetes bacterium]|nr:50S ribosomal protein L1 [Planctomycetota bacterium]
MSKPDLSHGKRYRKSAKAVVPDRLYPLPEAVRLLQTFEPAKFDETVDLAIHLGIDPKKTDQLLRGAVSLPRGLGRTVRVAVFAEGDAAGSAKDAGADFVGSEDLAKKVLGGWTDFDIAIAHPDQMKVVGRLGKVLGPQGKMPSPKSGTVTPEVGQAVREFKAGKVEFRTDAGGNVHAPVGKRSFPAEHLVENVTALLDHLRAMRPAAVKGVFFSKVVLSSTMSPAVLVEVA